MSHQASSAQVDAVVEKIGELGLTPELSRGEDRSIIGVIGGNAFAYREAFAHLPGIQEIVQITKPYKLASREWQTRDTVIDLGGVKIGGEEVVMMAGPCSVEGVEMLMETARHVASRGAKILRGGAFKPRTSPYSFQGLGVEGLRYLAEERERTGLPVITEVMEPNQVDIVAEYADILQIGTRNMQNYSLLRDVGRVARPVMLKRGYGATVEEWLMAAEYIVSSGNPNVILCERGIRTFETYTRNTMDLAAVPLLNALTHLPVVVDPSHATGKRWLVKPLAIGGVAVGADGVMVEVHPNPDEALSDAEQQLDFDMFRDLMAAIVPVHEHVRGLYPAGG
jgi:3-deoxy-7-phosphoheptulonate synthase